MPHDGADAAREIAGDRGGGAMRVGKFMAMTANGEDAFGVFARIVTTIEHGLVAGLFALFQHLPAYPPDHWMEPEQRLHQPMQVRGEIVAPRDVLAFVRQHGVHLFGGQSPEQRGR
jgi:hypothetical protein